MKFASILAFAAGVTALPAARSWSNCVVTDKYAEYLVSQSIVFLEHKDLDAAKAAAYAIFDTNIQEFGDSINALRSAPVSISHDVFARWKPHRTQFFPLSIVTSCLHDLQLGTQVENGITQYVTETTAAPGVPQINTLDIVHNCNEFVWHWEFLGIGVGRIHGFTLGKVNDAGKIYYQAVEFNSLTWATDIGFTVTPPTSGPFASGGSS